MDKEGGWRYRNYIVFIKKKNENVNVTILGTGKVACEK